jgi:hypothetical protein
MGVKNADEIHADNPWAITNFQPIAGIESLASYKAEGETAGRVFIRFVSCRERACDPDNLIVVKWMLDSLRAYQIIKSDGYKAVFIEVIERKARPGEEVHTKIEIVIP